MFKRLKKSVQCMSIYNVQNRWAYLCCTYWSPPPPPPPPLPGSEPRSIPIQWNLWQGDTSKSVPTWQVSPRHRYISMLKYILVHRKCNALYILEPTPPPGTQPRSMIKYLAHEHSVHCIMELCVTLGSHRRFIIRSLLLCNQALMMKTRMADLD